MAYHQKTYLWLVLLITVLGVSFPGLLTPIKADLKYFLMAIMLSIGLSIEPNQFKILRTRPGMIGGSVVVKYLFLPGLAWVLATVFHLSLSLKIGMVMIAASPGGTASSFLSYISKANVPLALLLTMLSTVVAIIAMPSNIWVFFHQHVPVPYVSMLKNLLLIVLIPILVDCVIKTQFQNTAKRISSALPWICEILIVLAIGCIAALNSAEIRAVPFMLVIALVVLNFFAFLVGYLTAKFFRATRSETIAICFEHAVLDSALGGILAIQFFGHEAALPAAIIVVIQNITASIAVWLLGKRQPKIVS